MQESIVMDERNRKLRSINFEKFICSTIIVSYENGQWTEFNNFVIKSVELFGIYSLFVVAT